jgi:glycosyltransferase involved in cell wall biosynthesis
MTTPASSQTRPQVERPSLDLATPIVLFADEWGGYGGTAGYVIMLSRELVRRGYAVAVICHDLPKTESMRRTITESGATVLSLPVGRGPRGVRQLIALFQLRALLCRYRDGVLGLMMGYFTRGGAVTLAARLAGMKGIVRADLTPPEPPIAAGEARSLRLKDRITDRVVVGALENIEAFVRSTGRDPDRMSVIHTGVQLERFHPRESREGVRDELGYTSKDLVIGTVARLDDERKGIRDFLQAAARIQPVTDDARFLIVGEGVHRAEYEQLAAELGVDNRVTFTGWRADVPRLLDAMDVFVMPSLFEGGPTSVLEAMAMALPVVATRVGMVPEVIDDGVTGLTVPPGDSVAIASALEELLGNPSLRHSLGTAARLRALDSLGIERMADDYLRLFGEVCASSGGHAPDRNSTFPQVRRSPSHND